MLCSHLIVSNLVSYKENEMELAKPWAALRLLLSGCDALGVTGLSSEGFAALW